MRNDAGKLTYIDGDVKVIRNGNTFAPLVGSIIEKNDKIVTGDKSTAVLTTESVKSGQLLSVATIRQNTEATIEVKEDNVLVVLAEDKNSAEVISYPECEEESGLIAGLGGFGAGALLGGIAGVALASLLSNDDENNQTQTIAQMDRRVDNNIVETIVDDVLVDSDGDAGGDSSSVGDVVTSVTDNDQNTSIVEAVLNTVIINDNRSSIVNTIVKEDSEIEKLLDGIIGKDSIVQTIVDKSINVDLSVIDSNISNISGQFTKGGLAKVVDDLGDTLEKCTDKKSILNPITDDIVNPCANGLAKGLDKIGNDIGKGGDKSFAEPVTDLLNVVVSGPTEISSKCSFEQKDNPLNFIF